MYNKKYDEIRPYHNDEIPQAINYLMEDENFYTAVQSVIPHWKKEDIKETLQKTKTSLNFQINFMYPGIQALLKGTSKGFTFSGFENIKADTSHVFISNHRDIFLDSGLLEIALFDSNFNTSQITFGSNLIVSNLLKYIGKVNKMVAIKREGNKTELYQSSVLLSAYIRELMTTTNETIWIAQGNGRTKNGVDETQVGLLKMLNMSGESDFVENFRELSIVPFSISYEYEPCDIQKARELYISSMREYVKSPTEDVESIISGVVEQKGRIHLKMGTPIDAELEGIADVKNNNQKFRRLKEEVDRQIRLGFRLYEGNYIAADLLKGTTDFAEHYTNDDKIKFVEYTDRKVATVDGDKEAIKKQFLGIYANPVFSKQAYSTPK